MLIGNISVIIPTFNRINCLKDTINSFLDGDTKPNEIVVIDQSTDENTRKQIESFCFSIEIVKYIFSDIPSGAKARNIGIRAARNEIIVFSDDDTIVKNDTLSLVKEIMQDDNISLIAGLDINSKPQGKLGYLFGTKSFRKRNIGHVTSSVLGRFPNKIEEVTPTEWAMGFFFVVRKSLIEKTNNYFDDNFSSYSYAEDLDFSYRYVKSCNELGYNAIIHPEVKVNHLGTLEYRIANEKSDMMYIINRYYISYKNKMGWTSRAAMWWTNLGMILYRFIKKENYKSLCESIKYLRKHKKKIKNLDLN